MAMRAKLRRLTPARVGWVLAIAGLASPRQAEANDAPAGAAGALFEAQNMVALGRYREACGKFEESLRRQPALATEMSLADCWERAGQAARAWEVYRGIAAKTPSGTRAKKLASARAAALESRLGQVATSGTAPDSALPAWAGPASANPLLPVDAGERAAAPSYAAAYVAGGIGLAGLTLGAVSGWLASSKLKDARKLCTSNTEGCPALAKDDYEALKRYAKNARNVSHVAIGVGALGLVAGGIFLYVARKKASQAEKLQVSPSIGMDSVGVSVSGSF